ncbi:hypothetical protein IQ266_01525 [filamentous cyanobacterium LEGE 11480]|uniref:Uncharacterized protein n=1 Tax=Romeriopsis navalis LEGE 11480 TaxID=2777977 RepID=A0A928VM90_9CYAN|nr:hypothetical protein [Romeriopsis navalis]MBE9028434.1 hypothetical protein [Romeriopsis navalis LEGE 11480]
MRYRIFQPDDRTLRLETHPSLGQWALVVSFALLSCVMTAVTVNGINARQVFQCDRATNQCQLQEVGLLFRDALPPKTLSLNHIVAVYQRTERRSSRNSKTYLVFALRDTAGREYSTSLPAAHNVEPIRQFLNQPQRQQLNLVDYQVGRKLLLGFLTGFGWLSAVCWGALCGKQQRVLLQRDQQTLEIRHHYNGVGRFCSRILGQRVFPRVEDSQIFAWSDIRDVEVYTRDRRALTRREKSLPKHTLRLCLNDPETPIDLLHLDDQRKLIDVADTVNAFRQIN